MAKRGETRPWRVRFRWDNGVNGTATYATRDGAEFEKAKIERYAELADASVTVSIEDRRVTS